MTVTPDPRIIEGLAAQALLLRRLESDGARLIGWKAGFGAPAALAAMALDAPLVGFLTDATRLDAGADGTAPAALTGWVRPMAEAEVAVILASDVPAGAAPEVLLASVGAVAPAIELADLDLTPSPEAVVPILAGDIFHRHVLIGAVRPTPDGWPGQGLRAEVRHARADGTTTVSTVEDVEAGPGTAAAVLAACAAGAARIGPGLRRGDVVILGSMVPPIAVAPGDRFTLALGDWPEVAVDLTA